MIPTCAVTCILHDQSGAPEVGAIVRAKLSHYEVYNGYVVPETVSGTTDADGQCVLDLWPNALGATESVYEVTLVGESGKKLRTTALVPNTTTAQLHLIAMLPPYEGKSDGELILEDAIQAGATATAAATAAASSETNAATSETNAATSEATATSKAAQAATSESSAATSAANAALSETNAATDATNAASSATSAALSQASATTSATNASTSETNAASSETNAANSATAAASSATNAASSETAAAVSETHAGNSATAAATSETNASTSATNASASETNAASSETNAANSATAAASSETNAASSETNAANSATAAASSETNAANSATAAASSETNAATSATSAAAALTATETARDQTLAAYDDFDDRYLGAKSSDPSLDNDGNTLVGGTLYFNTTDEEMKLYTGSVWVSAYVSGTTFLATASNLSDVPNAATARTNLGLGSGDSPTFASVTATGTVTANAFAGDGSGLTGVQAAGLFKGENGEVGAASGAGDIFRINENTLNTDVTIDADENASATGPLTVASGVTLTVNGTLVIL